MRRLLIAVAVTTVATLGAAATTAAAPPLSGVIYAADTRSPGIGPVTVNPNGGSPSPTCAGDPSYSLPRLYVAASDGGLVWSDETCAPSELFRNPGLTVSHPRWSPTGRHVAFLAGPRTDPPSYERSVYLASTSWSDDRLSVNAVTRVGALPDGGVRFAWSPDGERLVLAHPNPAHKQAPTDPDSSAPNDIYSMSVADGSEQNLTDTPGGSEYDPVMAPDGVRIAFVRQTVIRGAVRSDIFTMPAAGGASVQVTSKANTNTTRNNQPVWSPDGAHLAFACVANALGASSHVCRIDSLGRTKAVDLTPKSAANFSVTGWR